MCWMVTVVTWSMGLIRWRVRNGEVEIEKLAWLLTAAIKQGFQAAGSEISSGLWESVTLGTTHWITGREQSQGRATRWIEVHSGKQAALKEGETWLKCWTESSVQSMEPEEGRGLGLSPEEFQQWWTERGGIGGSGLGGWGNTGESRVKAKVEKSLSAGRWEWTKAGRRSLWGGNWSMPIGFGCAGSWPPGASVERGGRSHVRDGGERRPWMKMVF